MQQLLSLRCCCSISSGFYSDPFGESARWSTKTWIFGCFFLFESFNSFPENCLGFAWFLSQPRFGHSYSWGFMKVFVQELQVIHNMETVWSSSLQVDWSARSSWILHDGRVSTEYNLSEFLCFQYWSDKHSKGFGKWDWNGVVTGFSTVPKSFSSRWDDRFTRIKLYCDVISTSGYSSSDISMLIEYWKMCWVTPASNSFKYGLEVIASLVQYSPWASKQMMSWQ